jgi:hypothetical protein
MSARGRHLPCSTCAASPTTSRPSPDRRAHWWARPELRQALGDLKELMATRNRVSLRLDRRVDPLADELLRSLRTTRRALARVDTWAAGHRLAMWRVAERIAAGN